MDSNTFTSKDKELLEFYKKHEKTIKKISNNVIISSEDPLASVLKNLIRKRFDFDKFNTSNFITMLIHLCKYKYNELYESDLVNENDKEKVIYLACFQILDQYTLGLTGAVLSYDKTDIEKINNIFRDISYVIFSLLEHSSGGNVDIVEDYISKITGKKFIYVLNNIDNWIYLKEKEEDISNKIKHDENSINWD